MIDVETQHRCEQFLTREAELLDNREIGEWLDLLTEDIEYAVPKRITREKDSTKPEFKDDTFFYNEDKESLALRVKKWQVDEAWGENPPSRTRRIVGNVRVSDEEDGSYDVKNNFIMYHNKGIPPQVNILSGERHDTLHENDGELKLAKRTVFLDLTDLNIGLTVFL